MLDVFFGRVLKIVDMTDPFHLVFLLQILGNAPMFHALIHQDPHSLPCLKLDCAEMLLKLAAPDKLGIDLMVKTSSDRSRA
nr:hypothetical protein [Solobacterium moorei]